MPALSDPFREMSPGDPWVRIVIVTYNSGSYTQDCLEALAAQTEGGFEAVIVDNLSTDGSIETLRLPDARFRILRNSENSGFAGGSNIGLAGASTPYVMTLNPDTVLKPDCLEQFQAAIRRFPGTDMFSPVLWREDADHDGARMADGVGDSLSAFGIAWRNGHGTLVDPEDLPRFSEVFSPSGAAALYHREAFEREGGFDRAFFCYIEDIDLGLRLRAGGSRCILVADAIAIHSGGHSTAKLPGFAIRQTSRNMLIMIILSVPTLLVPIMLVQHLLAHAWFQHRNKGTQIAVFRREGFESGKARIGKLLQQRLSRPGYRPGAAWRVGKRLSWSIRDVNQRRVRIFPLSDQNRERPDGAANDRPRKVTHSG